ncbi:Outer membrane protein beta-barrel domain-containing protein [Hymenobacter gelipurpurascens]|uniref:Outer membrane protein beta-barrel domain-containing protein n=1 Tax=Hymenobacter gelipurpurascens TaxID=89968 RepID=A0A212UF78_9BACT|nr:outer membrane beta-barrel protein [Hymenobacter gelipurpurascens]SNC76905.1 Outer membrane protein beta-barrel domain-containing protein [Hymenobacter gelipurpurascens]
MLVRSIGIGAVLFSFPLLSFAQTSEPETPRYYVGVSAFTNFSQRLSRSIDPSTVPPLQLTLGYQLNPRWAVQLGASYSTSPGSYSVIPRDANGNVIAGFYSNKYRNTSLALTALGRYTLTRDLNKRFQVDAIGGFSLDYETYKGRGYNYDPIQEASISFNRNSKIYHKALSIGPSFRYRLFSGLEAIGEGTVNMDLRSPRVVTPSGAIGLRYRFGSR